MLTLEAAEKIATVALAEARKQNLKPLGVIVLDARGALRVVKVEDGNSLYRAEVAIGKAHGALAMGLGSRALYNRVQQQPYFLDAVGTIVGPKGLIPVPGGVLIRDAAGEVVGAVGVSGDTSDRDEEVAVAGIAAAGLVADPGA